jgi:hypothetical protein
LWWAGTKVGVMATIIVILVVIVTALSITIAIDVVAVVTSGLVIVGQTCVGIVFR